MLYPPDRSKVACVLCQQGVEEIEPHLKAEHPTVRLEDYALQFPSAPTKGDPLPESERVIRVSPAEAAAHPGGREGALIEKMLDRAERLAYREDIESLLKEGHKASYAVASLAHMIVLARRSRAILEKVRDKTDGQLFASDHLDILHDLEEKIGKGIQNLEKLRASRAQEAGEDPLAVVEAELDAAEVWVQAQIGEHTERCLAGDTVIKTFDGERRIGDLAGQVVRVLDGHGKWVEAPIKHYGQRPLWRVVLSRNGVRREVYTTEDHRWYVRPKERSAPSRPVGGWPRKLLHESTTVALKPRQRIPSVWAMPRTGKTWVSPIGVMAGFVYGDGSQDVGGARAFFYGEKDKAILKYFAMCEVQHQTQKTRIGSRSYLLQRSVVQVGLPRSWKSLPSLDEGHSYLLGWLAGYFAADGTVSQAGDVISLSSADRSALEFVVTLCDRLGIATTSIASRSRVTTVSRGLKLDLHTVNIRGETLTPEVFLLPEHHRRYELWRNGRLKYKRTNWWVVSVEKTDRVEDVFCAEVQTTSSFVLTDNILTGNCPGCGQMLIAPALPHWAYEPMMTEHGMQWPVWSPELWTMVLDRVIPLWVMAFTLRTSPEGLKYTARKRQTEWPAWIDVDEEERLLRIQLDRQDREMKVPLLALAKTTERTEGDDDDG